MNESPLSWRSAFPIVESAEEGVCIFIAQEIGSLIQFPRGVEQVVTGQLPARVVQQTLKPSSFVCQAALQRSRAQVQLSREILYSGALTGD